jgi:uncharacterized protein YqjF (DUF2071 family)
MTWLQRWSNVLFLHFAVEPDALEPLLPAGLEVDLYDGQAWISYVLFRLTLRPPGFPYVPGFSSLFELNVRTYVRCGQRSGIFFLRVYADNRLAIAAARMLTPIPYRLATMRERELAGDCRRISCCPAATRESLAAEIRISRERRSVPAFSLDHWLLERYRLFVPMHDGRIAVAPVEHAKWEATPLTLIAYESTFRPWLTLSLPSAPDAMHYSPGVTATFGRFQQLPSVPSLRRTVRSPADTESR